MASEQTRRAMWSGAISFGLVSIPVRMFPAVSQKEVHFHMLHREDGGRVHQKLYCAKDGEEIGRDAIIKGYELHKGKYVPVEPAELKKFVRESTNTIEISDFVELDEIDPVFYERSYH